MKRLFLRFLYARSWRARLTFFSCVVGCLLLVALGTLWLAGAWLTWPARTLVGALPADLRGETVSFVSESGANIKGWLIPGQAGAGVVLLLHPVRSNRTVMLERARMLARLGYGVLLIDQQAHGESTGAQITFGYLESRDARAAASFLRQRYPQERLGVIGVSLGGAATLLANPPLAADAFVFEMVFPDVERALLNRLEIYLGAWSRRPFAPLLLGQLKWRIGVAASALRPIVPVQSLKAPKLFIVGELDPRTTLIESQELFAAAAAEPKELWIVPQARHEDFYAKATMEYEQRVTSFFARHLR